MRMSQQFGQTLRELPADVEVVSHRLLVRAGFIRQLAAGIFSYLPLAKRSLDKIKRIMHEEMQAIGGQDMEMPVVNPASVWQETKRWYQIGSEMGRFQDKNGRDMVLAMTHEEVVTDLVRQEIQSYKQLPKLIYHIQTKWRDDPRPRAGLIRVREFHMKDSYSLDATDEGLDQQYWAHYEAYFKIYGRCGLPTIAVQADVGMMGGSLSHEYMYLTPIGEDTLLICDQCGHKANQQVATFAKSVASSADSLPLSRVATPDCKTIDDLATFLGIEKAQTAKAVFLVGKFSSADGQGEEEKFVFAVLRGDMELSETKLSNAIKAKQVRPATVEEIGGIGAVAGYASPIGLDSSRFLLIVDDAVTTSPNLVAGANEAGYHLLNTNFGRDYTSSFVADIASAQDGAPCPVCGAKMVARRGVEVGNIFKLGTRYTSAMGAYFTDETGKQKAVIMGSYGIGVGRLLACAVEEHHDEKGLALPISIAPYQLHLIQMKGAEAEAEQLYRTLTANGVEVLFDDRDASPGVKFNDADLLGLPLRVTVGKKALAQGGVEFKLRGGEAMQIVPLDEVVTFVQAEIGRLLAALQ